MNCSFSSPQVKHDIVSGLPPNLVAEVKIYGLSGYYPKNLYGKSDLSAFLPTQYYQRVVVTREKIEEFQPNPGSYLGDVLRLSQVTNVAERLMILVLQKSEMIDKFGKAMLAVQVSEREHDREFNQFLLRISEI